MNNFRFWHVFFALSLFFAINYSNAQKNKKIWEAIHSNNRKQALKLSSKLSVKKDIENLLIKKIVEVENGYLNVEPSFINEIEKYPDFENYLFSNWMDPYFFSDYLKSGFNEDVFIRLSLIDTSKIKNPTVKNGLYYLEAISKRYKNDWETSKKFMKKINPIKDWEFCGVFENLNSSGIDMPYEPENNPNSNVTFDTQGNGETKWYKPKANNNEVYNFFENQSEYGTGIHYAQTFIISPEDQRVLLRLGKGGVMHLWLNDVLVIESNDVYITELDAFNYEVNLKKGVNRILLKFAADDNIPYFIIRLNTLKGEPLLNYSVSFENKNYNKNSKEELNPVEVSHSVETFFKNKLKDSKSDVNLNKYCLYNTYIRNGKVLEALNILEEWQNEFPNSSLIKILRRECNANMGEAKSAEKLEKNILMEDPDYYASLLIECQDFSTLQKLDIDEYEKKLNQIGNSINYSYFKTFTDLMILLRRNDRNNVIKKLDELIADKSLPSSIRNNIVGLYSELFNDDGKTIEILEADKKSTFIWSTISKLAYYYEKQNRIEDALQLYISMTKNLSSSNNLYRNIVSLLHKTGQYERSLKYIDTALENFPNSYVFTKLKGDAALQLNKKQDAIELYKLALKRNPADNSVRNKINDLEKYTNPLNDFHLEDAYNYIKKKRKTIKENNYGVNTLLSQMNVLGYKNGGGEFECTFIYEITSQNGIDIFKEYDLGLYGNYLIRKSEIVKADGRVVPADRNGSSLVFEELEIGDVIYIDYQKRYTSFGRFYKDQILSNNFKGYHPTIKTTYRFLYHKKDIKHLITNGDVNYKVYKKNDLYVHEWSTKNLSSLPISENYMPTFDDITTKLHISTIESWNYIANWYSDLVRKQLKIEPAVEDTFKTIFPEGHKDLSEKERAKRIYYYITKNLNYSSVSFRQSGYVPQKPSKTIKTKLGDCKDFSSLFLVLAQMADLKSNLVLILTSDYGSNNLVLPSTGFNHCIVKVKIDGKDQFLELTNKYLPFSALPISLRGASSLEIPVTVDKDYESDLFQLKDVSRQLSKNINSYVMEIGEDLSNITMTSKYSGHGASYYINIKKNEKGELLNETIKEEINNKASETVKLEEIESLNYDEDLGEVILKTKLTTDLTINEIGDIYTFKIPFFLNPYTKDIIENEKRLYPIEYKNYENADYYEENNTIKLKNNEKFIDLPENVTYRFKEHLFSLNYSLQSPNEINIKISSKVNSDAISPEDYPEFKEFVKKVMDTRDVILKYKKV